MSETDQLYMYLLVNDDLKMGKGKIAGQVGHAVGEITEQIIRSHYELENRSRKLRTLDCYARYMMWKKTGQTKIVLKATREQLEALVGEPESVYVRDAGRTQIAQNSLTVVGFYPSSRLKERFKDYKLL